jgi:hypothetical protein
VRLDFVRMSFRRDLSKVYSEKSLAESTGGNLVLRQLQRQCGVVSIDDRDLVRSLTITQLESLGDALLDFNGMADLEVWFKANLSPN